VVGVDRVRRVEDEERLLVPALLERPRTVRKLLDHQGVGIGGVEVEAVVRRCRRPVQDERLLHAVANDVIAHVDARIGVAVRNSGPAPVRLGPRCCIDREVERPPACDEPHEPFVEFILEESAEGCGGVAVGVSG
jgi:hypothetical protein